MGGPMARNLLRAGHTVTVHNRSPGRLAPLIEAGATAAGSASEVARASDAVVISVPDTPDVEAIVGGSDGILAGASPGLLVIDTSTIAPKAARALAERAAARDVAMLDAPVSGGEGGAIAGTLSIMVGGRRDAFERAAPIFAAIGRTATYMGEAGQGQMTKLVNQVVGAATLRPWPRASCSARAGLDPRRSSRRSAAARVVVMWTNLGRACSGATSRPASWSASSRRTFASRSPPPPTPARRRRSRRSCTSSRRGRGERRRRARHAGDPDGARGAGGATLTPRRGVE